MAGGGRSPGPCGRFWGRDGLALRYDDALHPDVYEARLTLHDPSQPSERTLRMVVEAAPNAIVLVDANGRILLVNAETERLFGYTRQELLGQDAEILVPERYRQVHAGHRTQYAKDPVPRLMGAGRELFAQRKDGSEFLVEIGLNPIHSDHGPLMLSAIADISDRRTAETTRLAAATAADRQKDEFLAMLGHELRNPLAPMRNAIHLLKSHAPGHGSPVIPQSLAVLERQLEHMVRLVDDLLDVSRIIEGRIELQRTILDIAGVVARGIETALPMIEQRRQRLETSLPREPSFVEGDLVRLAQVIANLLTNAARYSPELGRIRISASREGAEVCVRVQDEGIGIAPELLPRVFDLFIQGQTSLARSQGGLGIGLTLVRRLVALHGGRVRADSAGPGRGSEFSVWLPLAQGPSDVKRSAAEVATPADPSPRRVLVVDDNVDAAETAALVLGTAGHVVRTCFDGRSALAVARDWVPQAVLLDIGLPDLTGYEVARQLRELPEMGDVLIVAVTGYGQDADRQQAHAAGIDHHVTKPVAPPTLLALLARERRRP